MTNPRFDSAVLATGRGIVAPETRHRRVNNDYVVTILMEHFVTVEAVDEDQAKRRAIEKIKDRWTGGIRPKVKKVEELK